MITSTFAKATANKKIKYKTPTIFIVLGVTGDLATRKIIPALFSLFSEGMLPKKFIVVGFSRRNWDDKKFKDFIADILHKHKSICHGLGKNIPKTQLNRFLKSFHFQKGFFEDKKCYKQLHQTLINIDNKIGVCTNKLFHLAVPPSMYELIFKNLAKSKLTKPCSEKYGWTRVLVEKPFGKDLKTAIELDKMLSKLYKEEQIFRIDHYLAKETLQNILAFRFSNTIFEPIWNKDYVDRVEILLHEKSRVTERGKFYDENGALRDVGQNHVLQMLALIAMDDPRILDASTIRKARAQALKALIPIKSKHLEQNVSRGQYKGYTQEQGVDKQSKTETYFKIHAHLKSRRWKGVPFILEAGKNLKHDCTKITIYFKEKQTCVCDLKDNQHLQNELSFHIKPKEGITTKFWAKKSGFNMEVEPRKLSFDYHIQKKGASRSSLHPREAGHDAYEQLIFDAIRGEQTLFASTNEVLASWKFITPILENWHATKLLTY